MEKVRLRIEELSVQSFDTAAVAPGEGTVHGHDAPSDALECPTGNAAYDTCAAWCTHTCQCNESGECTVEYDCWYTDWGPCTWGSLGNPSDC